MKERNYTYTEAQLDAMETYKLTEAAVQLFTQLAIIWDENDRPRHWKFTYNDLNGLFDGTFKTAKSDCGIIRNAGLVESNMCAKSYRFWFTDEGLIMARMILDRNGRKFQRLYVNSRSRWNNRVYNAQRFTHSVRRYACHIYTITLDRHNAETPRAAYYADVKHIDAIYASMRGPISAQIPLPDRLRKLNAPKMLIDKVEMFNGSLPNWLRYDVEQFIGEKLSV